LVTFKTSIRRGAACALGAEISGLRGGGETNACALHQ
jgi:hypothetical protein